MLPFLVRKTCRFYRGCSRFRVGLFAGRSSSRGVFSPFFLCLQSFSCMNASAMGASIRRSTRAPSVKERTELKQSMSIGKIEDRPLLVGKNGVIDATNSGSFANGPASCQRSIDPAREQMWPVLKISVSQDARGAAVAKCLSRTGTSRREALALFSFLGRPCAKNKAK